MGKEIVFLLCFGAISFLTKNILLHFSTKCNKNRSTKMANNLKNFLFDKFNLSICNVFILLVFRSHRNKIIYILTNEGQKCLFLLLKKKEKRKK